MFNYYQQMRNKSSCVFVIYLAPLVHSELVILDYGLRIVFWVSGVHMIWAILYEFEDCVMGVGCEYDMSYFVWVLGYRL